MDEDKIRNLMTEIINNTKEVIELIRKFNLQHEQYVLNFFDTLNELSVIF